MPTPASQHWSATGAVTAGAQHRLVRPGQFRRSGDDGLISALQRGLPTLLIHSTLAAFPKSPLWREIVGGGWTYGSSCHPEYAVANPTALSRWVSIS